MAMSLENGKFTDQEVPSNRNKNVHRLNNAISTSGNNESGQRVTKSTEKPATDQKKEEEESQKVEKDLGQSQPLKKWQLTDFTIPRAIARGSIGNVFVAREKTTGFYCAMKIVFRDTLQKLDLYPQLKREVAIHFRLHHVNICRMYGYFDDSERIYLMLENCHGNLDNLVKHGPMEEQAAKKYASQLVSAIDYCHARGVIHRDIKTSNILLDRNNTLKVTDFGWSTVSKGNPVHTHCGTYAYMAPERLYGLEYNSKVDCWSIAIVIFELLCGFTPFEGTTDQETIHKIKNNVLRVPKSVKDRAQDLLKLTLTKDPASRLSIKQMKVHDWFTKNEGKTGDIKREKGIETSDLMTETMDNMKQLKMKSCEKEEKSSGRDVHVTEHNKKSSAGEWMIETMGNMKKPKMKRGEKKQK